MVQSRDVLHFLAHQVILVSVLWYTFQVHPATTPVDEVQTKQLLDTEIKEQEGELSGKSNTRKKSKPYAGT